MDNVQTPGGNTTTAGAVEMARRIAAHALCGPEKWKPGVKAGIYEEIMRGDADAEALVQGPLAAIIEMQSRDDRLTFTERGDLVLHLVWALKPGQPQIVAVCTHADLAEKYKAAAGQIVPGAAGYVEEVVADHAFGNRDVQSSIYRAANMKGPKP